MLLHTNNHHRMNQQGSATKGANGLRMLACLTLASTIMLGCDVEDPSDEDDLEEGGDTESGDTESGDTEDEFRWYEPTGTSFITTVGGNGGINFGSIGEGMIYRFKGRAGSRVDRLEFGFYLPENHAGLAKQAGDYAWNQAIADDDGGLAYSWIYCPANYAAVGYQVRAGSSIDKFGLICAHVNNLDVKYYTSSIGGNGGTYYNLQCPGAKPWLVGFEGRAGDEVDQLRGICANPG